VSNLAVLALSVELGITDMDNLDEEAYDDMSPKSYYN
jgi:hypothetical protein